MTITTTHRPDRRRASAGAARARHALAWGLLMLTLVITACGKGAAPAATPGSMPDPDRFLFDRGTAALAERNWLNAREYFRQVVDNYPQSPLRPDAKLGIGDSFLGENSAESLVMAANEFREFMTFYPTSMRADYAQYKLAMSHYQQMRAPERDQTETRQSLAEFEVFFTRFPSSPLITEVRQKWREARDRLSDSSFRVGLHYFRQRWYPGAIDRFREVLKDDPMYTRRDSLYFYLAECLARTDKTAEAIPYFERLLSEFTMSEHLEETKERLASLKKP
jgi:outer membrane protein assembly factor BamD